jgi:hypothetical protein
MRSCNNSSVEESAARTTTGTAGAAPLHVDRVWSSTHAASQLTRTRIKKLVDCSSMCDRRIPKITILVVGRTPFMDSKLFVHAHKL